MSQELEQKKKKMSWDEYFINIAKLVAKRSSCSRRQVGAVVVRENLVVSTGYNGTPKRTTNCDEGGCERCANTTDETAGTKLTECLCVHAEENSIIQAAFNGVNVKDATLYTSLCSCLFCAKSIINAGIIRVFYSANYSMDDSTKNLFKEAGVELVQYKD